MVSNEANGYRVKCSSCGAQYWYSIDKLDEYGSVECQNCAAKIFIDSGFEGQIASGRVDQDALMASRETREPSAEGLKIKCPNCMARYIYKDHQRLENDKVECQNCGMIIDAIGEDVVIYGGSTESSNTGNGVLICLLVIIFLFVPLIIAIPTIACILLFKGISESKSDDGERKVVRRDGQGPSVR